MDKVGRLLTGSSPWAGQCTTKVLQLVPAGPKPTGRGRWQTILWIVKVLLVTGASIVSIVAIYSYITRANGRTHANRRTRPRSTLTSIDPMPPQTQNVHLKGIKLEKKALPGVRFPLSEIRGRKVTCSSEGIVLSLRDKGVTILPTALPMLLALASNCDLYLITQCDDDEVEESVTEVLKQCGVFDEGMSPYKSLFCSTTLGKAHIARQLESFLHIDTDRSVISTLLPHIPQLAVIDKEVEATTHDDYTYTAPSLYELFAE